MWRFIELMPNISPHEPPVEIPLRSYPLKMRINPQTYIGRHLYYRGMYEELLIETLSKLLRPGQVFIDVGANIGLYSLIASSLVGKAGQVFAIEPQTSVRQQLIANLDLNGIANVAVYDVAVAASAGEVVVHQMSTMNDGAATTRLSPGESAIGKVETVHAMSLDDIVEQNGLSAIHGMKIDIEGAELDALASLQRTLASAPPSFIFVECIQKHLERFGHSRAELIEYLISHNYGVLCMYRGKWRSIKDIAEHDMCQASSDLLGLHNDAPHLIAAIRPRHCRKA